MPIKKIVDRIPTLTYAYEEIEWDPTTTIAERVAYYQKVVNAFSTITDPEKTSLKPASVAQINYANSLGGKFSSKDSMETVSAFITKHKSK